jgi:DNA repair exonuclease SbcCD ATPase subunit
LGVGNCPTCNQPITGEHIKKELSAHNKEIEQFKSQSIEIETQALEEGRLLKKIEVDIKHLEKIKEKNEQLQHLIYETKTLVLRCEKSPEEQRHRISLENIEVSLEDIENRVNPYKKQEEERKSTLFDLVKQSKDIKTGIEAFNQETQYYRFWADGFKSIRISLFGIMLDRFQSFAQNLLSQYSSELQIQFSTERETRSGTMKEEFDISVTDSSGTTLSYEMYSGGEKQKIRLSIAMALASMIKDDCGKDFNFIAFDEPNDALDEVGKEVNFEVFTKLAMGGKAVLVTDHDSIFKDKFDHSIMVIKKDNKSCI